MRKYTIAMLTLVIFFIGSIIAAEEPTIPKEALEMSGLSGQVIDENGKPVPDYSFVIVPMHIVGGRLEPLDSILQDDMFGRIRRRIEFGHNNLQKKEGNDGKPQAVIVKTQKDGKFHVTNIPSGFVQLASRPSNPEVDESDKKILSIQFGKFTVREQTERFQPHKRLTFALPVGKPYKNVKITVQQRLRIHAQVVYADGTPVANTDIDIDMEVKSESLNGSFGTFILTNEKGYFTHYMDEPGVYTLSVEYQGLSAAARPFQLDEKTSIPENLVLKLNGNHPTPKKGNQQINRIDLTDKNRGVPIPIPPNLEGIEHNILVPAKVRGQRKTQMQNEIEKAVWIINPANGHAYKKIPCIDWHDAQQTAIKEDAHLVSLNNKDEHLWVLVVFGQHPCWIGLNDVEKEGEWRWDSGEPVTYTSWSGHQMFPSNHPDSEKDYVAITLPFGGWQAVAPGGPRGQHSPLWNITRHAIIEKDGLISKVPEPDTNNAE